MKKLALLLSLALSFSAIADDHAPTSSYLVESIPFKLKDGKTMADMMAMQDEFAAVAQASGLQYSAFVMTPHYMSQSSAPIAGSFDAVWLGYSPSATAIGAGFEGYMENGQELEAKFDEIRTMSQRSLMRGEMVHAGDPSDGGFGMFRTCTLNDGADTDDLRAALKARGAAFEKAGATASTHMWYGGIGIPNEMQGSVIIVRIFPSMEAWGQAFDRYFAGDFAKEERLLTETATCGPVRTYFGTPFYSASAG
jgi:hypothetical protein